MNFLKFSKCNSIILFFSAIALLSIINLSVLYLLLPGKLNQVKTVIIEPKLTTYDISKKLSDNNIISWPKIFWIISKIYSFKKPLKSGEYQFTNQISPYQVLKILSSGKSIIHKLVIPEGTTVHEIITIINNEERLFGEIKGVIPEGFLMPSTYYFSYGDQKEQIINQMRNRMSAALDKVMANLQLNAIVKTRLEVLILASIIEKETHLEEEKPLIAGVFLNRLQIGMKLQADPTTIYAITNGKFKLARPLAKSDLLIKSPYNTYYVRGLPPTAISCPGIKSLEAVVNPAETNALYFVINGKGGHSFSKNFNDHLKNINKIKTGN